MAALAAIVPMSAAVRPASAPPNLPMGVRTAEMMKTSVIRLFSVKQRQTAEAAIARYTKPMDIVYGLHAVEEALKARGGSFEYVAIFRERRDAKLQRIMEAARTAGVPVRFMSRDELTKLTKSPTHQAVAAVVKGKTYADIENVLEQRKSEHLFLVVLDGVEDPH